MYCKEFHFILDESLRPFYTGTFLELLNPFALCMRSFICFNVAMHGAFFLQVKTEGVLQQRAKICARICALLLIILFIACGVWVYYGIDGYVLSSVVPHDGPSNPLYKEAVIQSGSLV